MSHKPHNGLYSPPYSILWGKQLFSLLFTWGYAGARNKVTCPKALFWQT